MEPPPKPGQIVILNGAPRSGKSSIVAVILRTGGARSIVLWAALGAGLGVAGLTQLVPADDPGLLAATVRFELPKTIHYWVPLFLAILAASGLEGLVHRQAIPVIVRARVPPWLVRAYLRSPFKPRAGQMLLIASRP